MIVKDKTTGDEGITCCARCNAHLSDGVKVARAVGHIQHIRDGKVIWEEKGLNVKTTAGIDFMFAQSYGTSAQANGLNYIALSNDTLTETTASTTLSSEIASNGLARHIGAYAHTAGASTATVTYLFTATGAQAAQKAALFSASSGGTMNHVLAFTQRSLQTNDQLNVGFTLTLS